MQNSLDVLINQANIPGAATATMSSNQEDPVLEQAGITRNDKTGVAVNKDTIFEAASLSKPVFAYIVLKMTEHKKSSLKEPPLKLDTSLLEQGGDYGHPNFIKKVKETKIEHYNNLTPSMILSHQAGVASELDPTKPETFDFIAPIGEFSYSSEAYQILRGLVESKTDKKLEVLAEEMLPKIGMINSTFSPPEGKSIAVGHNENGEVDKEHFRWVHAGASLYTTAEDYTRFLRACAEDEYICKHMFKPAIELFGNDKKAKEAGIEIPDEILKQISWGLGMGLQTCPNGDTIAFHWGDNNDTCRNFAAINLTTKQAVTCLTNSQNGPVIFKQVAEPVVGDLTAVWHWLALHEKLPTLNPTTVYREDVKKLKQQDTETPVSSDTPAEKTIFSNSKK